MLQTCRIDGICLSYHIYDMLKIVSNFHTDDLPDGYSNV
jgi:hypothetical protein